MDTQYFYIENPTYHSGDRVFCVLYELQVALMIIPELSVECSRPIHKKPVSMLKR